MGTLTPKRALAALWLVTSVLGAALLMEVDVLNPALGGIWLMFVWVPATIVWAVGALRNHPIRSTRDVAIFVSAVVVVGVLFNLPIAGGMILLTGIGLGMLSSTIGNARQPANIPNPYRNRLSRILMGVSGITILAHASRVMFFFATRAL